MTISATESTSPAYKSGMPAILVADDDKDDLFFFEDAFAKLALQAELLQLRDGEEVMNYLRNALLPLALFLDVNMPRKNGFQCLLEIKANPLFAPLPVFILSTTDNEAKRNQLLEAGALAVFSKPIHLYELLDIQRGALQMIGIEVSLHV